MRIVALLLVLLAMRECSPCCEVDPPDPCAVQAPYCNGMVEIGTGG